MKHLLILGLLALTAQADVIISNLPAGSPNLSNDFGPVGGLQKAMAFTVGNQDITLTGVKVAIRNTLPVGVGIDLKVVANTNSGNNPWTSVPFASTSFLGVGPSTAGTISAPLTGSKLYANTVYWLLMSIDFDVDPDNTGTFEWLGSDEPKIPTGPYATHFASKASNDGGQTWSPERILNTYQLEGTVEGQTVPEPSTFLTLAASLLLLGKARSRLHFLNLRHMPLSMRRQ
jgi:hypothetical protein